MSSTCTPTDASETSPPPSLGRGHHGPVTIVHAERLGASPRARRLLQLPARGVDRLRHHAHISMLHRCRSLAVVHAVVRCPVGDAGGDRGHRGEHLETVRYERTVCRPGTALDEVLDHEPPTPTEAGRILTLVQEAVTTLHRAGVAHGNLAPSNIFVERRGAAGHVEVLVTDAGVAVADGRLEDTCAFEADDDAMARLEDALRPTGPRAQPPMARRSAHRAEAPAPVPSLRLTGPAPGGRPTPTRLLAAAGSAGVLLGAVAGVLTR